MGRNKMEKTRDVQAAFRLTEDEAEYLDEAKAEAGEESMIELSRSGWIRSLAFREARKLIGPIEEWRKTKASNAHGKKT